MRRIRGSFCTGLAAALIIALLCSISAAQDNDDSSNETVNMTEEKNVTPEKSVIEKEITSKKAAANKADELAEKLEENKRIKESMRASSTICAVTLVKIDITADTLFTDYNGSRYYFINSNEKAKFDKAPYKFTGKINTCTVCGTQADAKKVVYPSARYKGHNYPVCSNAHKDELEKNPEVYVGKAPVYFKKK
jgi:YHS domain-containing protein